MIEIIAKTKVRGTKQHDNQTILFDVFKNKVIFIYY
jgi:hypothetical protein